MTMVSFSPGRSSSPPSSPGRRTSSGLFTMVVLPVWADHRPSVLKYVGTESAIHDRYGSGRDLRCPQVLDVGFVGAFADHYREALLVCRHEDLVEDVCLAELRQRACNDETRLLIKVFEGFVDPAERDARGGDEGGQLEQKAGDRLLAAAKGRVGEDLTATDDTT